MSPRLGGIDLEVLPPTLTVPEAAKILGVSSSVAYEAARRGQLPGVLRLGSRRIVVATHTLLAAIGIDGGTGERHG